MRERARWREVERLFHRALEIPPGSRQAFLDADCVDAQVRREVEALLREDAREDDWLEGLARRTGELADDLTDGVAGAGEPGIGDGRPGERIGPYRLERELGRGGTSVVYLGRRIDGAFDREVAIKVLARHPHDESASLRVRRELRALSGLTHPNIARLYDGGVADEGRWYLVMEYVDGEPIDEYCSGRGLGTEARVRLFMAVVEAVSRAHRSLVIHRDLKPSNILVTADGTVKLLDFGVAKVLSEDVAEAVTRPGDRWLTPEYAAPEQIRGDPTTTATDVYQLGVVLYELLTGRRAQGSGGTSYLVERSVLETDPVRPSLLDPDLPSDLDAIVLTALRKEPGQRYGSAEALGRDLQRFLERRPIEARPATLRYRTMKFVRRNGQLVSAAAAAVLLLAGLTGVYILGVARERDRARLAAATATEVSEFVIQLFDAGHPAKALGDPLTAPALLERGVARAAALHGQPAVQARVLATIGRAYHAMGDFARADSLFHRSLELRRARFGPVHREVADALELIAWNRLTQKDFRGAEARFQEALAVHRATVGDMDRSIGNSLHGLALALNGRGATAQGIAVLEQALRHLRSELGPAHADIANAAHDLAILRRAAGDLDTATAHAVEALAMRRTLLDADHPDIARSSELLGDLHRRRGDLATAESLYREAVRIRRRVLGEDHVFTRATEAVLDDVRAEREQAGAAGG